MPWGYALRSYCVGGTKYAVGIPNILRIISMGVPDILGYMVRGCLKPGKPVTPDCSSFHGLRFPTLLHRIDL